MEEEAEKLMMDNLNKVRQYLNLTVVDIPL
jgi:hypothetical protein